MMGSALETVENSSSGKGQTMTDDAGHRAHGAVNVGWKPNS